MRKTYPPKMHKCSMRFDFKTWEYLKKIARKYDDDTLDNGGSKVVRKCVDYCIKNQLVEKIYNGS